MWNTQNMWLTIYKMSEWLDGIKKHERTENGKVWYEFYNPVLVLALLWSFFIGCLWGQPRPIPRPDCTSSIISSYDKWLFGNALIIVNLNYSLVLSSNVLSLLPFKAMCFEAYKGPYHWLNHLFRTHHLQGLVAMLTSFSNAPRAPASAASIPAVRPTEVG